MLKSHLEFKQPKFDLYYFTWEVNHYFSFEVLYVGFQCAVTTSKISLTYFHECGHVGERLIWCLV